MVCSYLARDTEDTRGVKAKGFAVPNDAVVT